METRGTAILIDNECVASGPEFNGDMYPHGHGDNFLRDLSRIEDRTDFMKTHPPTILLCKMLEVGVSARVTLVHHSINRLAPCFPRLI